MSRLGSLWWRVRRWLRHPITSFRYWWNRGRHTERRAFMVVIAAGEKFRPAEMFAVLQWASRGAGHVSLRVGNVVFLETGLPWPAGAGPIVRFVDLYHPLLVTREQEISVVGDPGTALMLSGTLDVPSRRQLRARRRAERRKEAA